jgi:DNA polymerase III epsilon subunit family exonuclease
MGAPLSYTMFQEVLFPKTTDQHEDRSMDNLLLQRVIRYEPALTHCIRESSLVIFDFEATGLDSREDEIIEIGAVKWRNGTIEEEFSTLVRPRRQLSEQITTITGITNEMLVDAPEIHEVWTQFLDFANGSILVAHNADFDMSFVWSTAGRLGYQIHWPAICTLKMARAFLPDLPSKSLDALAEHFKLTFEARHRSIGDVKVTGSVLQQMLDQLAPHLLTWNDFAPFRIERR